MLSGIPRVGDALPLVVHIQTAMIVPVAVGQRIQDVGNCNLADGMIPELGHNAEVRAAAVAVQ